MKKSNQILKNQTGMGLLQGIITLGVLGASTLFVLQFVSSTGKVERSNLVELRAQELMSKIRSTVRHPTKCDVSLVGLPVDTTNLGGDQSSTVKLYEVLSDGTRGSLFAEENLENENGKIDQLKLRLLSDLGDDRYLAQIALHYEKKINIPGSTGAYGSSELIKDWIFHVKTTDTAPKTISDCYQLGRLEPRSCSYPLTFAGVVNGNVLCLPIGLWKDSELFPTGGPNGPDVTRYYVKNKVISGKMTWQTYKIETAGIGNDVVISHLNDFTTPYLHTMATGQLMHGLGGGGKISIGVGVDTNGINHWVIREKITGGPPTNNSRILEEYVYEEGGTKWHTVPTWIGVRQTMAAKYWSAFGIAVHPETGEFKWIHREADNAYGMGPPNSWHIAETWSNTDYEFIVPYRPVDQPTHFDPFYMTGFAKRTSDQKIYHMIRNLGGSTTNYIAIDESGGP